MHSPLTRTPIAAVLLFTSLVSWSTPAGASAKLSRSTLRTAGLEESNQRPIVEKRLQNLPAAGLEEQEALGILQKWAALAKPRSSRSVALVVHAGPAMKFLEAFKELANLADREAPDGDIREKLFDQRIYFVTDNKLLAAAYPKQTFRSLDKALRALQGRPVLLLKNFSESADSQNRHQMEVVDVDLWGTSPAGERLNLRDILLRMAASSQGRSIVASTSKRAVNTEVRRLAGYLLAPAQRRSGAKTHPSDPIWAGIAPQKEILQVLEKWAEGLKWKPAFPERLLTVQITGFNAQMFPGLGFSQDRIASLTVRRPLGAKNPSGAVLRVSDAIQNSEDLVKAIASAVANSGYLKSSNEQDLQRSLARMLEEAFPSSHGLSSRIAAGLEEIEKTLLADTIGDKRNDPINQPWFLMLRLSENRGRFYSDDIRQFLTSRDEIGLEKANALLKEKARITLTHPFVDMSDAKTLVTWVLHYARSRPNHSDPRPPSVEEVAGRLKIDKERLESSPLWEAVIKIWGFLNGNDREFSNYETLKQGLLKQFPPATGDVSSTLPLLEKPTPPQKTDLIYEGGGQEPAFNDLRHVRRRLAHLPYAGLIVDQAVKLVMPFVRQPHGPDLEKQLRQFFSLAARIKPESPFVDEKEFDSLIRDVVVFLDRHPDPAAPAEKPSEDQIAAQIVQRIDKMEKPDGKFAEAVRLVIERLRQEKLPGDPTEHKRYLQRLKQELLTKYPVAPTAGLEENGGDELRKLAQEVPPPHETELLPEYLQRIVPMYHALAGNNDEKLEIRVLGSSSTWGSWRQSEVFEPSLQEAQVVFRAEQFAQRVAEYLIQGRTAEEQFDSFTVRREGSKRIVELRAKDSDESSLVGLEENLDRIKPIRDVARKLGILSAEWKSRGQFIAKIKAPQLMRRLAARPSGRLVIITGMTPTPAGEGKTTTTIGLLDGLAAIGVPAVADLREPSLGPVFGAKGTATGTGRAQLYPARRINLSFTGDFTAVSDAHNYLVEAFKNALYWETLSVEWDAQTVLPYAIDLNARGLRDQFILTPASEVMAILGLAKDSEDLRRRLGQMIVAWRTNGIPITAQEIDAVDNMMALLEYAVMPNLVQTYEGNPVFVHTGPFANIAHGTSSVIATELSQKLVGPDGLVIQEAGFGSDLGFEKFADVVAQQTGLTPDAAVLVVSARALKWHGGVEKEKDLTQPNLEALRKGLANLDEHLRIIQSFNVPPIVAINQFPQDAPQELAAIRDHVKAKGIPVAVYNAVVLGSEGSRELAQVVSETVKKNKSGQFRPLYTVDQPFETKMNVLATLYGASGVDYSEQARRDIERAFKAGYQNLYPVVVKTPASLSDNPGLRGVPTGWRLNVQRVSVSAGAGFLRVEVGEKPPLLMPGLPKEPRKLDPDPVIEFFNDEQQTGLEEDEAVLQRALGDPEERLVLESTGSVTLQEVGGSSVTVTAMPPETASLWLYLQAGLEEPAGLPATVSVQRLAADLPGVLKRWQEEPPSPRAVIVWNAGVVDEVTVMAWMPLVSPSPAALRMTSEASHEITANIINTLAEMARRRRQGKILEIRSITYLQVGSGTYAIIRAA